MKVARKSNIPFTFPVKLTDTGAHAFGSETYPGDGVTVSYKEDILVGYRWFDTKKIVPQFPFGYGLSYTTFAYGKAKVDKTTLGENETVTITVPVKNTGKVTGKEVVELYVKDEKATELRPEKELKAFSKVELKAGEEQNVSFTLDKTALQFYSDVKKGWIAEPGKFTILIGSSSRDIKSTIDIELK